MITTPTKTDWSRKHVEALPYVCYSPVTTKWRQQMPECMAVYVCWSIFNDVMMPWYVGQSLNLRQRWSAHHRTAELNGIMQTHSVKVSWYLVEDAADLLAEETAAIEALAPVFNDARGFNIHSHVVTSLRWGRFGGCSDVDYTHCAEKVSP